MARPPEARSPDIRRASLAQTLTKARNRLRTGRRRAPLRRAASARAATLEGGPYFLEFETMAQSEILAAEIRERQAVGTAQLVAKDGFGVVYGDNKDPLLISVHPVELMKLAHKPGFSPTFLKWEPMAPNTRFCPRPQFHPVTDNPPRGFHAYFRARR